MNAKSPFLHCDLSEEIYMEHPLCFMIDSSHVFQLHNSLHGLKQAPQAWYYEIDQFFVNLGFKHCESDHSIYVLHI